MQSSMSPATPSFGFKALALSLAACSLFAGAVANAAPVRFTGFIVTDVSLNGTRYHNAEVTLTFVGDTNDVTTFQPSVPGCANCTNVALLSKGAASVSIDTGSSTISAQFPAGEIFIAADTGFGGIGFGSTVASGQEPAYPLAFTEGTARNFANNFNTSTGANPAVLGTTVNLSGHGFSCIGYPASAPACLDPTPYPLKTSKGDLIVYQPYVDLTAGAEHGSMNRGLLTVLVGSGN